MSHSIMNVNKLGIDNSALPTDAQAESVEFNDRTTDLRKSAAVKRQISTGVSLVELHKKKEEKLPKTHKEMMAEIESTGERSRSILSKKRRSVEGTVQSFMVKAQRAAHNFAKDAGNIQSSIQEHGSIIDKGNQQGSTLSQHGLNMKVL